MIKRISSLMLSILLIASMVTDTFATYMPRTKTPDYNVAFYAFDCYHMQDENGKRSGYGYEMMQGLSNPCNAPFPTSATTSLQANVRRCCETASSTSTLPRARRPSVSRNLPSPRIRPSPPPPAQQNHRR